MAKKKPILDMLLEKFQNVNQPVQDWGQQLAQQNAPRNPIVDQIPMKSQMQDMFNPEKSVFYQKILELYNKFSQKKK